MRLRSGLAMCMAREPVKEFDTILSEKPTAKHQQRHTEKMKPSRNNLVDKRTTINIMDWTLAHFSIHILINMSIYIGLSLSILAFSTFNISFIFFSLSLVVVRSSNHFPSIKSSTVCLFKYAIKKWEFKICSLLNNTKISWFHKEFLRNAKSKMVRFFSLSFINGRKKKYQNNFFLSTMRFIEIAKAGF